MWRNRAIVVLLTLMTAWHVGPACGQATANERTNDQNAFAGSPLGWNVEPIIDQYIKGVTRHYNLTAEQEVYTKGLMTKRVKSFLKDYEKDVRSLFAEYIYYQVNKELPSPEMAKDWAGRATPLAAAIRREILEGNAEWRQVLDEDQLRKHDKDLELMERQFDTFDKQMERWSRGEVQRSDIYGQVSQRPFKLSKSEDAWEYRVRSFIQEYNLDAGQRQTAYSILRELRQEAGQHRAKHEDELNRLETQFKELSQSGPKSDPDELRKVREERETLEKRWRELERPISGELHDQLMARLQRIPTAEQRRARDLRIAQLDARSGGRGAASRTTQPAGTTRPAGTSQPAETDDEPAVAASSQPAVAAKP